MKSQKGFLLVAAIILIIVIGMIGLVLTYLSVGQSESTVNVLNSEKAFFVAASGLEIAKRDVGVNSVSCNAYSKTGTLFGGQYLATGQMQTGVNAQLNAGINATVNTIKVNNTSSFPNSGIAQIITGGVAENIIYNGKNSTQLLHVVRGLYGSTATNHNVGDIVTQKNVCNVISTGALPSLADPLGKRIVQQQLLLLPSGGYLAPGVVLPNLILPTVLGIGNVFTEGSLDIYNTNQNGKGCAIATAGAYNTQGAAPTYHCNSGGNSSIWANNINSPAPPLNTSSAQDGTGFYNYFFTQSPEDMMAGGYHAANAAAINNVPADQNVVYVNGNVSLDNLNLLTNASSVKTIIINGDLELKNINIGSADVPVKIIVTGNLTSQTGNGNVYGFIYVQGTTTIQTSAFTIHGAIASYGDISLKNAVLDYNQSVFNNLGTLHIAGDYSSAELFP